MSGTRSAKPVADITQVHRPVVDTSGVPQMVRSLVDGEPLREVASFRAGRLRCVLDHNGNAELTMRIPAQDMPLVIPAMGYPGIEMHITAYVPEGVE